MYSFTATFTTLATAFYGKPFVSLFPQRFAGALAWASAAAKPAAGYHAHLIPTNGRDWWEWSYF